MPNKPNQHFVPRLYLKYFTFQRNSSSLFCYDKQTNNIFTNTISKTGSENDFYTIRGLKNKYEWDDFYSAMEPNFSTTLGNIVRKVTNLVLYKNCETISIEEKQQLAFFIIIQMTRGKKYIDFVTKSYKEWYEKIVLSPFNKEDIATTVTNKNNLTLYLQQLVNRSWVFFYSSSKQFITSDEPVGFYDAFNNDIQGLLHCPMVNTNTIITFPICPEVLLVTFNALFSYKGANKIDRTRVFLTDDTIVTKHNSGQFLQCNRFLYSNSKDNLLDFT